MPLPPLRSPRRGDMFVIRTLSRCGGMIRGRGKALFSIERWITRRAHAYRGPTRSTSQRQPRSQVRNTNFNGSRVRFSGCSDVCFSGLAKSAVELCVRRRAWPIADRNTPAPSRGERQARERESPDRRGASDEAARGLRPCSRGEFAHSDATYRPAASSACVRRFADEQHGPIPGPQSQPRPQLQKWATGSDVEVFSRLFVLRTKSRRQGWQGSAGGIVRNTNNGLGNGAVP